MICPNCGRRFSRYGWTGYFAVMAPLVAAGLVLSEKRVLALLLVIVSLIVGLYLFFDDRRPPNKPGLWPGRTPGHCFECSRGKTH